MKRMQAALLQAPHLRDTMLPSSAGRLLILLEDKSRNIRLCSLAMSGGMRERQLSFRCREVRWVSDQRAELRLRTLPATHTHALFFFNMVSAIDRKWAFRWSHNCNQHCCWQTTKMFGLYPLSGLYFGYNVHQSFPPNMWVHCNFYFYSIMFICELHADLVNWLYTWTRKPYQLFQVHPSWIFSHCLHPHWTW